MNVPFPSTYGFVPLQQEDNVMLSNLHTLKKRTWRERLFTFPWNPLRSHRVMVYVVETDPWRDEAKKPAVWRRRPPNDYAPRLTVPVVTEPAPFLEDPQPFSRSYLTTPQLPLVFASGEGGTFDGGGASGRWDAGISVTEHAKTEPMPLFSCASSSSSDSSTTSSSSDSSSSSSYDSSSSSSSDSGSCTSSSSD